jgi:hypothetical protein
MRRRRKVGISGLDSPPFAEGHEGVKGR